jgi:hypothetical protein
LIAAAGWMTAVCIALRNVRHERRTPARPDRRAQAEQVSVWPGQPDDVAERGLGHHARVRSFFLGDGLGRRWSARCSCGWIVTTGSHPAACDEFARHHRETRASVAWRADRRPDRAAA